MTSTDTIKAIQQLLGATPDGIWGPQTQMALNHVLDAPAAPPVPLPTPTTGLLSGDGSWPWRAFLDGEDIVVTNARATCFGGADDPQDSGETASGISTKDNPDLAACSLPMDGRMFHGLSPAEHAALDGSPLPRVPWETEVAVTHNGVTRVFKVIDLGPGKRTGNAIDLTKAAARKFDPKATETNFAITCDFRILGGAKFAV